MARNRRSAKGAGTAMETLVAKALREGTGNPNVERLRTSGANDRGDIGNVRTASGRLVCVEVKDKGGQYLVGPWLNEVETERINYDAEIGVVVAKRRGTTKPGEQVVLMTVRDLIELLTDGGR